MKLPTYKQFAAAVKTTAKKGAEMKPVKLIKAAKTAAMTSIKSLNDKQQVILAITAGIENAVIKRDKQAMATYIVLGTCCGIINTVTGVYGQIKLASPDALAAGLEEYYGKDFFTPVNEEVPQIEFTTLQ